jgi:hypothetical protein
MPLPARTHNEQAMQMNQDICEQCLKRAGFELRFSHCEWHIANGRSYCPHDDYYGYKVGGDRKISKGPSKFCPYLLEQLMAGETKC